MLTQMKTLSITEMSMLFLNIQATNTNAYPPLTAPITGTVNPIRKIRDFLKQLILLIGLKNVLRQVKVDKHEIFPKILELENILRWQSH